MNNHIPKIQQFLALAVAIGLATYLIVREQDRADRTVERNNATTAPNTGRSPEASMVNDATGAARQNMPEAPHVDAGARLQPVQPGNRAPTEFSSEQLAASRESSDEQVRRQNEPYLHSSKVLTLSEPPELTLDPETVFLFSSKSIVMHEEVSPASPQQEEASAFTGWSTEDLQTRRRELVEKLRQIDSELGSR
ncbi:MAG: hypothetical protein AAF196_07050 [Planctomycetota bacterium]